MGILGKSSRKKGEIEKADDAKPEEKAPLLNTEVNVINETDDPFVNEIKTFIKVKANSNLT